MKKFSLKGKMAAVTICAFMACALAVGCNAQQEETSEPVPQEESSEVNAWKAAHPAEWYSFVQGGDSFVGNGNASMDGVNTKAHGTIMSSLTAVLQPSETVEGWTEWDVKWNGEFLQDNTCIACKSTIANEWIEEGGYMKLLESYDLDQLTEEDCWNCEMCHTDINDPAASLDAQSVMWKRIGGSLIDELDNEVEVCAQCHTATGFWMNGQNSSGANLDDESVVIDPYKYGTDPASLIKVLDETADDKGRQHIDNENGLWMYIGGTEPHVVEAFQGSVMQQAGLTCADCHMPTITEPDGSTYTSHDASGNPLDSVESLQSCLDCHSSQGIGTTAEMSAFVKEAQTEYEALCASTQVELDAFKAALLEAIAEGGDEATLDEARRLYAEALYFNRYCARTPFVHNPYGLPNYLNQESALIAEGMELLK